MSCWVVPTVAAEYWGVTLDVVWRRIYEGLIPHKNDGGFIFVDIDPWTPDLKGARHHEPPTTYVAATHEPSLSDEREMDEETLAEVSPLCLVPEEEDALSRGIADHRITPLQRESARAIDVVQEQDEDELPDLDEEESATFGRLSWHDVRATVSRTRRPPPAFRD